MTPRRTRITGICARISGACALPLLLSLTRVALADPQTEGAPPPDESVLGTVEVTGAAAAALPRLAVMPIVTNDEADTTLQLVVKKDLDLSGQFEVVDDNVAPPGLYLHDTAVDTAAWRAKGLAFLVRVVANPLPGGKVELLGSVYFLDGARIPRFSSGSRPPRPTYARRRIA